MKGAALFAIIYTAGHAHIVVHSETWPLNEGLFPVAIASR